MARLLVRLCSQSNKTTDSAAVTICDGSLKNAPWSVHQGKPVSVSLPTSLPYAAVVLSDAPVLFQTTYVFIWPLLGLPILGNNFTFSN